MNWQNLKNNKCPKCGGLLKSTLACLKNDEFGGYYSCDTGDCDFKISSEKFNKIVVDLYKPKKYQSDDDRFSELNNLGREEVTEGFLPEEELSEDIF